MCPTSDIYLWTGEQTFLVSGSGLHEDTLRILPKAAKIEALFTLVLPTLCITYADMRFQNAVGGLQANYPASQAYGPIYFDPPVEINGQAEIERLTYIRGAKHVVIGPEKTQVEFESWNELVIPRLRLDEKPPAQGVLSAANVPVHIDAPLSLLVMQFADGRHVGGVNIEVRHPDYKPPEIKPQYDLWVRLWDASELKPLVEVRLDIWHWDPGMPGSLGPGAFRLEDQKVTGVAGSIYAPGRPAGELEAVTAHLPGWRVTPRCFRPLAGQPVRITLEAWPMQKAEMHYVWQEESRLEDLAALCGHDPKELLRLSHLPEGMALQPGTRLRLPCYAGALHLDSWDTPQAVAERFHIDDLEALASANDLADLSEYDGSQPLQLPGWHFFHAGIFNTLQAFDRCFNLPPGSCVAVGRVFRPYPGLLYAGEVVGVPV
jgi:hypothetical protein